MVFITVSQVLSLLRSRGFGGEEPQDDAGIGGQLYIIQGRNYSNDWRVLLEQLSTEKRNDSVIVELVKQLDATELEIEDKTRTAEKFWSFWKMHCESDLESDPNEVDLDALRKEYQQRVNAGDQLAQDDLTCLDRLHELNMKKNSLVDRLFGSNCNYKCDVPPQRVLPDVLENAKSNGRRYHAVIVGINEYGDPTTPSLNGCVNDALLFRDYLIQDLSVPSNRIKLLLSPIAGDKTIPFPYKAPTRDNILQALCDLFHNPDIKHDDSIIFFYAGHGQSYREACCTPEPAGSIEAICPVDRNTRKINADGTEETILDICDREINVILGEIATKCPNITVILDCCFGGGGTRNGVPDSDLASLQLGDKESFMSRHCHPIPSAVPLMFKAADASGRLPSDRPHTADPNFRANMKSHVLIASAKDYELALEYTDRKTGVSQGYFTSRFISALRSSPSTATYRDVIRSPDLLMPFQTALAVGRKTARLWFA